ncbi:MAG TPA: hypothetical protein VK478_14420 [Gemmatimonadaceae bacterium]|nr:hypothetical protein [Gemmatimonadaceae bacterium]
MSHNPQRPFVPHRTPKSARPTIATSEFRLYRPFVPGAERELIESNGPMRVADFVESQAELSVPIRSIQDYLDASIPAATAYSQPSDAYESESDVERDELPPVEHFLDPLPIVHDFAPDAEGALADAWPAESVGVAPTGASSGDPTAAGWLETDWQQYDWRAAAALGESAEREASSAWATTDWDGTVPRARDLRPTSADAIATALDAIAQRIREGELAVPGSAGTSDPAKLAAQLAALLGVKQ